MFQYERILDKNQVERSGGEDWVIGWGGGVEE